MGSVKCKQIELCKAGDRMCVVGKIIDQHACLSSAAQSACVAQHHQAGDDRQLEAYN